MRDRWAALVIVAVVLLAYGNTVWNDFVYDDDRTVEECELISSWSNLPGLFTQRYFTTTIEMSWRPVSTFTYFVDDSLFGPAHPGGYHFINVLFHALACLALWRLMRDTLGGWVGPLLGALLFAVHPLGSEAVNGISYREDLLVGILVPWATLLGIRAIAGMGGAGVPLLAGLLTLLACLAKESGIVVAPLIVAWWLLAPQRHGWGPRRGLLLAASLLAAYGLFWVLRFKIMVYDSAQAAPHWGGGPLIALWNFPRIYWHFVDVFLWPSGLAADYEWNAHSLGAGWMVWLGWAGIAAVVLFAAGLRRHAPVLGFGLLWHLICLGPVSNLVALYNPVAERYLYLPLMGLCLAVGWTVDRVLRGSLLWSAERRRMAGLLSALVLSVLLCVTVWRNIVWGDPECTWEATLQVEPNSTTALNNLGAIRIQQGSGTGDLDIIREGRDLLLRAIQIDPESPDSVLNYGVAELRLDNWEESQRALEWSVTRRPHHHLTHFWMAEWHRGAPEGDATLAEAFQRRSDAIALAASAENIVTPEAGERILSSIRVDGVN